MEFLNPTAWYGLLALPLLLIPYLIRRKPRRLVFSSLLLFTEMGARAGGQPWGRLRLPPIFFLQLLLLTLLILALSEPVFSVRPSNIAIVLDNSASMQALEGSKTRFELAKEQTRALLAGLDAHGKVALYHTVPRLERIHPSFFTPAQAAGVISSIQPYDLGDRALDYNHIFNEMAGEHKYDRVYLITDHPARGEAGTSRVISVGQPQSNLALSAFQVQRSSFVDSGWAAETQVKNFSIKDEKVKVILRGGGTVLGTRDLMVAAGKSATAAFEGIPLHPYYEAEIDVRDALRLDNRRFAVPPSSQNLRILGISPQSGALASLRNLPGVTLDLISPSEYEKSQGSGYGLEIFHFSTPATPPRNPALFVLPPNENSLIDLQPPISRVIVSSWREPHALTRYINFALFRPSYGRPLKPQTAGENIFECSEGILAFATERQGTRYLVLGFDPFPYLGRSNLPMSIFTLNFLDWFSANSGQRGENTGEPFTFDPAQQGARIVTPKGDKISLKPGANYFSATYHQGIYQLTRGGERQLFAANLHITNESDLRAPAPVELRVKSGGKQSQSALFPFWPYLLLAFLLLLLIEWFIAPQWAPFILWMRPRRVS